MLSLYNIDKCMYNNQFKNSVYLKKILEYTVIPENIFDFAPKVYQAFVKKNFIY